MRVSQGHNFIEDIADFAPHTLARRENAADPMVRHYIDAAGVPRVQGSTGLKASQAYTPELLGLF